MVARTAPLKVAVVGGGLSGLECARSLLKEGCEVDIIEIGHQSRTRHVDWDTTKHPGDEKVRYWTARGWAAGGGGLSNRLGGRSLCYHGVLIEPPQRTLQYWGRSWADRFYGKEELFRSVLGDLSPTYTELDARELPKHAEALGMRHAPQAGRLDRESRFEAYSPLRYLQAHVGTGKLEIRRGQVSAVRRLGNNTWNVETIEDGRVSRGEVPYDRCVLAASAIGNVKILSRSLERSVRTTITDHFCVGAFVRLGGGKEFGTFRHQKLWTGYIPLPLLATNVFVLERPRAPNGDRIVELMAVVEQCGDPGGYSSLTVNYGAGNAGGSAHLDGNITGEDSLRLLAVRNEIRRLMERIAGGAVKQITGPDHRGTASCSIGTDSRWDEYTSAMRTIMATAEPETYCEYELPYGGFEHESCCHPIGERSGTSISENLEVLEMPNVYVAGPGVFPRLSEANPALTIIATSRWLGRHISKICA